jgi:2-(1,2-epoxy-1,2-dihydrophenyl)acetyl-CoA isomerase
MRLLKRAIYNAEHLTFDQAGEDIAARTAISDFHPDALDGAPAWLRKEHVTFNRWLDD